MAWFLKFKLQFALKQSFNWGQFWREISKFAYFNSLQIILNIVKKFQKLNICDGKLIKNEMLIKNKNKKKNQNLCELYNYKYN